MKYQYIYGIAILSIVALFFTSCGKQQQQNQQKPTALPFPVVKVAKKTITNYQSYPVTIEGEVNSEIRPKVSGYVKNVLVKEGQKVKQGQLLFKLETQSLSQDAEAAKAAVNTAQVEVNKLKPLVEKNIISPVQLETAKASLAQAKSAYNSIVANINYANIKSPVNGFVGSINYRKGALVSAQSAMPLTKVASIKNVYAYFSMNEKEFLNFIASAEGETMDEKIKKLPPVKLLLANGKEYEQTGFIETIAGDINQQTGTISFRAKFDNKAGLLRNGSSGTILIPKVHNGALIIPSESTFERQGKVYVYIVNNDSLAEKTIEIEAQVGKVYVVKSGLSIEQTILAKGLNKVRSGAKIKPVPTPLDSIVNSFDTVFK
ncbi:MAG: efflux RND transporter periplasmic adaptor subunit [Tenacibaculum sp.]|uniref:efflux RND transporter periplasmic adaptor subunit n=1 Tax=Tenacibaculum sp. TaxID=1906242 RepID=UPI0017D16743|nr:efflux RND transporter periplasmic adaptor subunit [Tenacibaculum sp.]NVK09734.1 efflux RND transporter periplasmic adaptor subunit [Tenacibaculum sp.]